MAEESGDFRYCFRKSRGLRLNNPNENLVRVYARKSKSAFNMLNSAIEKQEYEWILDISYYAKYFIVYALFMKAGVKSEIHDCTIFALKSLFIEQGIVDEDIYEELEKSRELRIDALYYDKDFGKEQIMERARAAPEFCLKVEQIIEKISAGEIKKAREKFEIMKRGFNQT